MLKQSLEWLSAREHLEIEWQQSQDEGRVSKNEQRVLPGDEFSLLDLSEEDGAWEIYDRIVQQSVCPELFRREPSDWVGIKSTWSACREGGTVLPELRGEELFRRIHGAWLGRCIGCLLGKPFEGWTREDIAEYLRDVGNPSLTRYATSPPAPEIARKYEKYLGYPGAGAWVDFIQHGPEDDDTNYTLIGLRVLEKYGRGFQSQDVAETWLRDLPALQLYTAERVAYRNLLNLHLPPDSATYRNPYREWVGAQIRGDFFGYINPGNPLEAARMAWVDGRVSHTRNGIYGEMLVSSMIAESFVHTDMHKIVKESVRWIPRESRLALGIRQVVEHYETGESWENLVNWIHQYWDEKNMHHWAHVIPNAMIVCASLLYGEGDLGTTIGKAVLSGFDTDCNGATAGSVLGILTGDKGIPEHWTRPLNGRLASGVSGFALVEIAAMATRTCQIAENQASV